MTSQQGGEALILLDGGELQDPQETSTDNLREGRMEAVTSKWGGKSSHSSDTTLAAAEWGALLQPGLCSLGEGGAMSFSMVFGWSRATSI